jgi:hypothetical protein
MTTEPRVLARYDGNSPANLAFRQALRNAPDETKVANLALLMMALDLTNERYAADLAARNLLAAQADDVTRMLLRREIREVQGQLGLDLLP